MTMNFQDQLNGFKTLFKTKTNVLELGFEKHEQKILEVELSVQKMFDKLSGAIETNQSRIEGQLFKRDFEITFKKPEPDAPAVD